MCSCRSFVSLALLFVAMLASSFAGATGPDQDGWHLTGEGVRAKEVAFIKVKAYAISHWVRKLPTARSKQAVIELEADKRFSFRMLRSVGQSSIKSMFRDAFALNGYANAANINSFVGVFTSELKEGMLTTIQFDATKKATTISTQNGRSATIAGEDFMRATWSIWFGKAEQPSLGNDLISKL